MRTSTHLLVLLLACAMLLMTACGDEDNRPPIAQNIQLTMPEDTFASGALLGFDAEGRRVTYRIVQGTSHGHLDVDLATGVFVYTPAADFFGADSFSYAASDGSTWSRPATVTVLVQNINDAPALAEIPDLQNSPETRVVTYQLTVGDVDGDQLSLDAISEDPSVAEVAVEASTNTIRISPRNHGRAAIHVTARDAVLSASRMFTFSVSNVTKHRTISAQATEAIILANTTNDVVAFTLTHNDFPMFQSDQEIVEYVQVMPSDFPDEPFQRKLWRFVRDNVYHAVPLSVDQWLYDPWVTVNSLGWGFCGHVAAVYVRLAQAAGYEARVWGLTGHVVPTGAGRCSTPTWPCTTEIETMKSPAWKSWPRMQASSQRR